MSKLNFLSLASGSSGNCYYLGTESYGILIDAGIPMKNIKKSLKDHQIPFDSIVALLVTHDHTDHIRSAGVLGEAYAIPVYSTEAVHIGINKSYSVTEKINASKRIIKKNTEFQIKDFKITCFEVPHDGSDNVGYYVEYGDIKVSFATDLGEITEEAASFMVRSNYLIIESNYDEEMLLSGKYPHYLKERIIGQNGHLSNKAAGLWLAKNFQETFKHIFLCHLSRDNNHPELAFKTVEHYLNLAGIKVNEQIKLTSLRRNNCSDLVEFI